MLGIGLRRTLYRHWRKLRAVYDLGQVDIKIVQTIHGSEVEVASTSFTMIA